MITIAFNEDENEEQEQEQVNETNEDAVDNINSASDNMISDNVKEKASNATEKTKEILQNEKVKAFIIAHIVPILIVIGIILAILILIGQFAFFTTIPGMFLEKVKEFGRSVWGEFNGFFTGDNVTSTVSKEDVLNLAQYLQNMGYDIESCGLGKAEYETTTGIDKNKTKQLKKIEESVDGKEYLKSYLASNEATYVLSSFGLKNFLKEAGTITGLSGGTLNSATMLIASKVLPGEEETSTGMINILDTSPIAPSERFVKIDRKKEKMTVYTNAVYLPIAGALTDLLGLSENGSIQWGSTFSYDMSSWTAKYGKPVELFLSVHLSTMMPDLAYRIAEDKELNTKVNIVLQNINVNYDTTIKTQDGTTYKADQIINAFLDYALTGDTLQYIEEVDEEEESNPLFSAPTGLLSYSPEQDSDITFMPLANTQATTEGGRVITVNFYDEILKSLTTQKEKNEFFANLIHYIDNNTFISDVFGINIKNVLVDSGDDSTLRKFVEKKLNNLRSLIERLLTGDSRYIVYIRKDDEEVPGLNGITFKDLFELADIVGQGMGEGIKNVKWPYIQSVTNHWYYNDIDFSTGVYRKATSAKKKIKYEPADDSSGLIQHNIEVDLDATLKADEGIVYQVCEPEAYGPNQHIIDIFTDKYYKYDGTIETSRKIDNAKLYEKNGGQTGKVTNAAGHTMYEIEDNTIEKEEVSFEDNKANALAAFSILENMHSEEGEFVYRNLKDLVVTLEYLTESDLTEELKNAMMWIIKTDDKNEEFTVTKDENEYGMIIEGVNGREVVAPENCEVSVEGGVATLKFTQMSASTEELLKYIYEDDYKNVNTDILVGLTMKIKGITNVKTGSAERGQTIGNVSGNLEVIMFDIDKSIIEDIEDYMVQKHNYAYETIMKEKMTKTYEEGIDIGRVTGDGFFRGNNGSNVNGRNDANSVISTGNGTWTYNESDMDLLYAITASEDNGSYEGALAVITSACNRTISTEWKKRGLDPLSQYRSGKQYEGYYSGNFKNWLPGAKIECPSYVKEAVDDAIKKGIRNHNYCSFNADYASGREQIGSGGNWYFDVIV